MFKGDNEVRHESGRREIRAHIFSEVGLGVLRFARVKR